MLARNNSLIHRSGVDEEFSNARGTMDRAKLMTPVSIRHRKMELDPLITGFSRK